MQEHLGIFFDEWSTRKTIFLLIYCKKKRVIIYSKTIKKQINQEN